MTSIIKEVEYSPVTSQKKTVQPAPAPGTPVSKEENEYLNKMFQNVKKTTTEDAAKKAITYFTTGKAKNVFSIDGTSLEPNLKAMLGKGTFEERYYQQLEKMVFGDDSDPTKMITLLMLVDNTSKLKGQIQLKSGKYRNTVTTVAKVLNKFLNENYPVLEAMCKMFNDASNIPQKEQKE